MSYFDRRPNVFRALFGTAAAFLFLFGGYALYRFGQTPTDENLFEDPPSSAYVTRALPAEQLKGPSSQTMSDSLLTGDLIVTVNGKRFPSITEGRKYVAGLSDTAMMSLGVFRPTNRQKYVFQLRKSALHPDFVRELAPTALVADVTPGGASDRAGMKVGDQIMRINGQTFGNVSQADSILRQGQIGKTIDYDILRANQTITLNVTLASFGLQFTFLMYALCGFCYLAVGVFFGLARPQFIAMRTLGIFFVSIGYLMVLSVLNRGLDSAALGTIRGVSMGVCLFAVFPALLHSFHYFPTTRPELLRRKWILWIGYALAAAMIIAIRFAPTTGGMFMIPVVGLYIFLVPLVGRRECSPENKRMSALIRWTGVGILCAVGIFTLLAWGKGGTVIVKGLGWLGLVLLVLPAAYLYTIGRYRLFNLALRVRRSVQYSFVSIVWTILVITAVMLGISWLVQSDLTTPYIRFTSSSIEVLDTPASQREQTMMERGVLVALAIGGVLALMRLHRIGGKFISEKFHRARYDYRRAAGELAEVMSSTLNMTDLAKGVVEKLASLMRLKRVGLMFFRSTKECCCNESYGFDGDTWSQFCLNTSDSIASELQTHVREMHVNALPAGLRELFRDQGFHYVVPIRSKERLVGLILLGEKLSESAFRPEDMEFLAAIAKQASVAIENAFLHEELTEQERLKHELAIARRIQLESLPQATPQVKGLEIAGTSIPALEVGGDYFDYLNGDATKLTVVVGDVSGKGTSAALYMSKVQGILRSLHEFGLSPRELFIRANHLLCGDLEKRSFVTALGAAFNTEGKSLLLARAGHTPLFHFDTTRNAVEKVTPRGLGLGLSPENLFATELEEKRIQYHSGDVFMFVTDGITEGQKLSGDEFGEERLSDILAASRALPAAAIRDKVLTEVKAFAGEASQHDDQTIVVVKVT